MIVSNLEGITVNISQGETFGGWEPTSHIRYAVERQAPHKPAVLEQKWARARFNPQLGYLTGYDEEWRPIALEVVDR